MSLDRLVARVIDAHAAVTGCAAHVLHASVARPRGEKAFGA